MFKPGYIVDNCVTFGVADTIALIAAKFQRMGKSKVMAQRMAHTLVQATMFTPEFQTAI